MVPRLTSAILVSALLRRAEAEGGFGAVLAKGDETSGSIIVILLEKGANPRIFERVLQPDGLYGWASAPTRPGGSGEEVPAFIARRRRFDPDSWFIELDVPSVERFADEMNSIG
jgi:hypothetical protein